jgi:hypothetical protein
VRSRSLDSQGGCTRCTLTHQVLGALGALTFYSGRLRRRWSAASGAQRLRPDSGAGGACRPAMGEPAFTRLVLVSGSPLVSRPKSGPIQATLEREGIRIAEVCSGRSDVPGDQTDTSRSSKQSPDVVGHRESNGARGRGGRGTVTRPRAALAQEMPGRSGRRRFQLRRRRRGDPSGFRSRPSATH